MSADPYSTLDPPARKRLRLANRDYSHPGPYFITICTYHEQCTLASVCDGAIRLSRAGEIAHGTWQSLPGHFRELLLEACVIMPNHLHAVLCLPPPELSNPDRTRTYSLSDVVGAFKSISTIRVNQLLNRRGQPIWHRSYYDHIIRNAEDLKNVHRYIAENPRKWSLDPENPQSPKHSSRYAANRP
jgi:putative transposase